MLTPLLRHAQLLFPSIDGFLRSCNVNLPLRQLKNMGSLCAGITFCCGSLKTHFPSIDALVRCPSVNPSFVPTKKHTPYLGSLLAKNERHNQRRKPIFWCVTISNSFSLPSTHYLCSLILPTSRYTHFIHLDSKIIPRKSNQGQEQLLVMPRRPSPNLEESNYW